MVRLRKLGPELCETGWMYVCNIMVEHIKLLGYFLKISLTFVRKIISFISHIIADGKALAAVSVAHSKIILISNVDQQLTNYDLLCGSRSVTTRCVLGMYIFSLFFKWENLFVFFVLHFFVFNWLHLCVILIAFMEFTPRNIAELYAILVSQGATIFSSSLHYCIFVHIDVGVTCLWLLPALWCCWRPMYCCVTNVMSLYGVSMLYGVCCCVIVLWYANFLS